MMHLLFLTNEDEVVRPRPGCIWAGAFCFRDCRFSVPSDYMDRKPRALVSAPARARTAKLSKPVPGMGPGATARLEYCAPSNPSVLPTPTIGVAPPFQNNQLAPGTST